MRLTLKQIGILSYNNLKNSFDVEHTELYKVLRYKLRIWNIIEQNEKDEFQERFDFIEEKR